MSSYPRNRFRSGNPLKIAWVESIRTLTSGGQIYSVDAGLFPMEAKLSETFDITFLRYQTIHKYISYRQYFLHLLRFSVRNASYLIRHNYDLLITVDMPNVEGLIPFVLGKLMRKPVLLKETHWYWPDSIRARLVWPINLWLVHKANLVIVPGKRVMKYLKQIGINPDKIEIAPFYASTLKTNAHTAEFANALRKNFQDKILIVYVGRLLKKKGVEYLIEAFSKVRKEFPNTMLLIIGNGPERRNLERLSETLKFDGILFFGAVNEEDKPAYFMVADVFVCPSITMGSPEEWGMVVIEAMSVGKPVVVTDATGSALDAVREGINGYIVPEKDSDSLYEAIKKLAGNADLRKNMGKESRRIAEGFSSDFAAQAMERAIRKVSDESQLSCTA